jgi:acetoin utilization protein AcuB
MLRVQEFMSRDVETVSPSATTVQARETMKRNRIRHLIVKSDKHMLGVISDRDVARITQGQRVCDVMTPNVVTVEPRATAREVANKMRGRTIGCMPVVENNKLVGIVTTSDLLELIGRGLQRMAPKGERPSFQRNKRSFHVA